MENNFDSRGESHYSYEDDDNRYIAEDTSAKPGAFSLFLGDLSYFCTEADLQQSFSKFGEILDIRIIRNKATKKSLSYGFIDYAAASAASNAMNEMNGKIVCGRAVRIKWASVAGNKEKEIETASLTKFCLYVGDISQSIDEMALGQLFQRFGDPISLKLKTKQTEKGPVNFAFVEFNNSSSALNAMKELDGSTTYGQGSRPLRVRWASNATASSPTANSQKSVKSEKSREIGSDDNTTVSIFTSFQATRPDIDVTDESLRYVFGRYGQISDVAIRLSVKDPDTMLQRGYAFVCFQNDNSGIAAAMNATNEMADCEVDGVLYKCEVSRRLVQKLGGPKASSGTGPLLPRTGHMPPPPSSHQPHPQRTPHGGRPAHPSHHPAHALSVQTVAVPPIVHPVVTPTSHTNYFGAQQGLPPENMLSPLQSVPNMTNMSPWPQNVVWNTPHPAYPHTQYPAPNLAHSPHGAAAPPQYAGASVAPGFIHFQQSIDPNPYNLSPMNQQLHRAPLPPGLPNQHQPHQHHQHQQHQQQHQQHHQNQHHSHRSPHHHQQQYHH